MLSLSNLKPNKGATKKRKRVGRGNASGHGTYSTRGLKGQNSRSGVSGLKRLGMKPMLLNLPKKRGFTSLQDKDQVVNLTALNRNFKEGGKVTANTLLKAGLIENASKSVKILGQGQLTLKKLELVNLKVSATAKAQIEKLGGKIIAK
jgi:large subunit ribosomal protein L15